MAIQDFSPVAASNAGIIPSNSPPSRIYTWLRDLLASVRTWYNDPQWVIYGDGDGAATVTWLSASSFSISGSDLTAIYEVNRRVKITGATTGTVYGFISARSFASSATTVTVTLDSGTLAQEALTVYLSILSVTGSALPGGNSSSVLGTAASKNIGTSGATVPLLNAVATISALWNFTTSPTLSGVAFGTVFSKNTGTTSGTVPLVGTASATSTLPGLVELATAAETVAGADATRAVTPSSFAGNADYTATGGFYKFPGGLIVQWGSVTSSAGGSIQVTYPVSFVGFSVVVAVPSTVSAHAASVNTVSTASFKLDAWSIGTSPARQADTVMWIAVGA